MFHVNYMQRNSLIGGNYMKSPKNIICKALKG
jgi:hypothetical protein